MGKHSRIARPRVHAVVAAALVAAGGHLSAGTASADDTLVAGTPCTADVRACVDLAAKHAWLIEDGTVVRGPVPISPGAPGH